MRLAHAICVLLVGASADVAVAAAADTCATGEAAETAIRRVLEDFGSAYIRHDTAALDKIFAEEFASTRPGRDNLITRADYFEAVRTDPNKNISITRADEKIRQYGCTAVVTDRTTRLAEDGPHVYRMTNVLTFRDGRWLMVTRHVSDAARPSPSPAPSSRPYRPTRTRAVSGRTIASGSRSGEAVRTRGVARRSDGRAFGPVSSTPAMP